MKANMGYKTLSLKIRKIEKRIKRQHIINTLIILAFQISKTILKHDQIKLDKKSGQNRRKHPPTLAIII